MRKAAFEKLLIMMKESSVLKASVLSGYSRSSYYYYRSKQQPVISSSSRNRRSDSTETQIEAALLEAIEKVALEYPSYGVRRITAMLHRSGIAANRKKVYRLMKLANLVKKRSVRKHVIMKRILTVPERPDQLWQQDITYIWCGNDGWCYLFSILDCYTREWLAYTFSTYCGTDEAIRTLEMAVLERFPDRIIPSRSDLATRSDGGSQYTSARFVKTLKVCGIRHEVTGKNRPDHNAYIEAFHKSLKEDCIWQHDFQTFQEAKLVIRNFFHDYNWNRPHSSLKYMTPKEFYAMINGGNS
jgi:putative transposase